MSKKAGQSLQKQLLRLSKTCVELADYAEDMEIHLTKMRKALKLLRTNFEDVLLLSEGANSKRSKIHTKVDVAMSSMVAEKDNLINKQVIARAQRKERRDSEKVREKTGSQVDRECAEHNRRVEDKRCRSTKRYRNNDGPKASSEKRREDEAASESEDVETQKKKQSKKSEELPAVDQPQFTANMEVNQEDIQTNASSVESKVIASLNKFSEAYGRNLLIIGSCDEEPMENNHNLREREDEAAERAEHGSSSDLPAVDLPEPVDMEDAVSVESKVIAYLNMLSEAYGRNLLIIGSCDGEPMEINSPGVLENINPSSCAESSVPAHQQSTIFPTLPFRDWCRASSPEKYLAEEILSDFYNPKKVVPKPAEPLLIDLITPEKVIAKPAEPPLIDSPKKVLDMVSLKKLPVRNRLSMMYKKKWDDRLIASFKSAEILLPGVSQ